jgi:hypothetical protein
VSHVNGVEPNCSNDLESLDLLDILAGQHGLHHKPPEVLKSQVFWFWSAGGILIAIKIIKIKLVSETQNRFSGLQNSFTFWIAILFSSSDAQVVNRLRCPRVSRAKRGLGMSPPRRCNCL